MKHYHVFISWKVCVIEIFASTPRMNPFALSRLAKRFCKMNRYEFLVRSDMSTMNAYAKGQGSLLHHLDLLL